MQQETVTLIVAGMGIAGTLWGGMSSQLMARKSQRRQWVADNRKQEARELLTALSDASLALAYWWAEIDTLIEKGEGINLSSKAAIEFKALNAAFHKIVHDRLFIANDVREAGILEKWIAVIAGQTKDHNYEKQMEGVSKLKELIVEMGTYEELGPFKTIHRKLMRP
jgi:hypothetical protein